MGYYVGSEGSNIIRIWDPDRKPERNDEVLELEDEELESLSDSSQSSSSAISDEEQSVAQWSNSLLNREEHTINDNEIVNEQDNAISEEQHQMTPVTTSQQSDNDLFITSGSENSESDSEGQILKRDAKVAIKGNAIAINDSLSVAHALRSK
ncbi:hypothetical protein MMC09_006933 [Bachmanniomyces sp. S44760]|nr:hypothetical protein [Bachmanniomyces sp. S44760]